METQTLQMIDEMNRILAEASAMGMTVDNARGRADRLEQIATRIERVETQADHGVTLENSGDIRVISDRLRHIAKRLEIVRSVSIVKANETLYLLKGQLAYQQQELSARMHFSEATYLAETLRALAG
jgi:negative regulator of genetic competence, sporulation and motility